MPDQVLYERGVQWAPNGSPYYLTASGQKHYLTPTQAGQSNDARAREWAKQRGFSVGADGAVTNTLPYDHNYFQERPHWDSEKGEWVRDIDWTNVVGTSLAGVALAAPLFGGAAAAGGPASVGAESAPGLGAGGALPLGTGLTAAGGAGTAATTAAAGGGSVLSRLKDIVPDSIGDVAKLAGAGASLIPAFTGSGGSNNPYGNDAIADEVKRALQLQRGRLEQAQPVYDSLVNMAYGMTPTRYRGAAPAGYPAAAQEAPAGPYQYEGPRFKS